MSYNPQNSFKRKASSMEKHNSAKYCTLKICLVPELQIVHVLFRPNFCEPIACLRTMETNQNLMRAYHLPDILIHIRKTRCQVRQKKSTMAIVPKLCTKAPQCIIQNSQRLYRISELAKETQQYITSVDHSSNYKHSLVHFQLYITLLVFL